MLTRTEEIVGETHANENDRRDVNGHILIHLNLFVDDQDKRLLEDLQSVFRKLHERPWRYQLRLQSTYPSAFPVFISKTGGRGRPPCVIPLEFLEYL